MNILIIGYGSIGKRHEEVLSNFEEISNIELVTKQKIKTRKTYLSLEDIPTLNCYDYFVIASETNKHYEQLKFLDSKVSGKILFCEKPLFGRKKSFRVKQNTLFVGYVLRFHPLLLKLKDELENKQILNANISCGQYLPTWRPNIDYRKSYSSIKEKGGGVLLDLSHEIDYAQWLFGKFENINSFQSKISDLEINSDDITTLIAKTNQNTIVNLSIDYISKIAHRKIFVNTINETFELDFIKGRLIKKDKNEKKEEFLVNTFERNDMFKKMHKSILTSKKIVCTQDEALDTMDTIYIVQEQNDE